MMEQSVKITYNYTNNLYNAMKWLNNLPDLIACDFETASIFTKKEKELIKFRLENRRLSNEDRRVLEQEYESSGLSHPSLSCITHLSIAWSDKESIVIVCDSSNVRKAVFNFLVNTSRTQIWHNAAFDHKHILHNTGKQPKSYIDTLLMAKSILNDANPLRDRVGLKELMNYAFGNWSLSKDVFTLEEMWNTNTIEYSAIDSIATFKLYTDLLEELE